MKQYNFSENVYHLKPFQWKGAFHIIPTRTAGYFIDIEEHSSSTRKQNIPTIPVKAKKGIPLMVLYFFENFSIWQAKKQQQLVSLYNGKVLSVSLLSFTVLLCKYQVNRDYITNILN